MSTCDYCKGTKTALQGIHFPSDFDDRPESCDGMVFVAACVECGKYASDEGAADAISRLTGWKVEHSHDSDDSRYYRVYFAVTLAEAERIMKP